MDIAVIGSNMVDLITYIDRMPKEGETVEALNFEMGYGGKGANQAVAAAKMGSKVMMLTKVGDDMFGDGTIRNLEKYHIDTEFVKKVPGSASGVAPIFVDKFSNNRILIIKGANQALSPEDIEQASEKLKNCSLILLQLEIPLKTVYHAIEFANANHIPVILNPAPASRDLDFAFVRRCDFLIPNETELEILTGMPVETDLQIRRAAETLVEKGIKNVIVTLGESGALWLTKDQVHHIPSYRVSAVDTTGAGDAFIGCFAHFFVQNKDVLYAIKMATAFAALSVTKHGTQASYPDREEFYRFLNNNNAIV